MERKLAAILAADVAGYSRLMEADEEGTLAALRGHREVADGLIAAHRGRVFNSAGDSVIAEFASAVEATLCAVEIQQEIGRRNAAVPRDKRLEFRIGLNIGDVMVDGGNLFGDGVNVADRVQKLAEPGGICIARNVHDHLRNKADLTLEPMGEHQVKNIAAPVSVYRVLLPGAARRSPIRRWAAALGRRRRLAAAAIVILLIAAGALIAWPLLEPPRPPRTGFPSVAVLPFQDFSGGAADKHYGDGFAEDLITLLSRFPSITVVSRNASFAYKGPDISIVSPEESFTIKGRPIDPMEVGRELGVDYVVEGSVQKKGNGLRITAQLIDTQTNLHVWADGYDGSDPSALQEEAGRKIAVMLASEVGQIRQNEYKRTKGKARAAFDAYDYYLAGHEIYISPPTLEDLDRAGAIWREGLEKFPDSALLRIALAAVHFDRPRDFATPKPAADYRRAAELLREAMSIPNLSPMERWWSAKLMAYIYWYERDFVRAVAMAEEAVKLSPYSADTLSFLARLQLATGNLPRGIEWIRESTRLDPDLARNTRLLAWAYYLTGEYEKSIEAAKTHELLSRNFAGDAVYYMAASQVRLGRLDEARATVSGLIAREPWQTQITIRTYDLAFP
ncbi:MAG TPA: adenylate/guanylate cyclase domain-containing protein, partial [Dongiaceae bacterium]